MKFLYLLFLMPFIVSCGSSNGTSPFTDNTGGSSSNIISATNFGVTASELSPQVLEFAAGAIGPTDTTALVDDLLFSFSPVDSEITVTAADNEGALVGTGTVFFSTQYGILSAPSCELQNGRCSVTWQSVAELSQLRVLGDPSLIDIVNVITVWTNGAEGFTDLNGDRILSENEIFGDTDSPYLDRNDDFIYTPATDDTILNTPYVTFNGTYEGPNCNPNTRADCGSTNLVPIYNSVYLQLNFDSSTVTAFNVVINTPADNVIVPLGADINFTATAFDPDDGAIGGLDDPDPGNDIQWSSDINNAFGTNRNDITVNNLSLGTHTITVTATNTDNNTRTDSITVTIVPTPYVAINQPANPTTINAGDSVSFTATALDTEDGAIIGTDDPVLGNDIVWSSDLEGVFGVSNINNPSVDTTGWTTGNHIITVTVTDSDGNTSIDTMTLTVN